MVDDIWRWFIGGEEYHLDTAYKGHVCPRHHVLFEKHSRNQVLSDAKYYATHEPPYYEPPSRADMPYEEPAEAPPAPLKCPHGCPQLFYDYETFDDHLYKHDKGLI